MNPVDALGTCRLKGFAVRRQQVPAQGTVADAALEPVQVDFLREESKTIARPT